VQVPYPGRPYASQALPDAAKCTSNPRLAETLVAHTGIPTSTFHEVFETPGDCITAAFTEGIDRISGEVLEAARGERLWLERINAGLLALLKYLDDEPLWAHLLFLERPFEGAAARECTERLHRALSEVLGEARSELVVGGKLEPPAELIAELLATAVFSIIRAQMLKGRDRRLASLAPSLMSSIVVPYLGRGAARADRSGHHSDEPRTPPRPEVLPIRPHPRPVLALEVIASQPSLSNQEVGSAVGIEGDGGGQIAKLLKPLERRGLIENASLNHRRGEPNAWLLTPYGHRVLQLLTGTLARPSFDAQLATPHLRASRPPGLRSASVNARVDRSAA